MANYSLLQPYKGTYVSAESAEKYVNIERYKKAYANIMDAIRIFNSQTLPTIKKLQGYAGKQNYYVNGDTYSTHIQEYIDTCFIPFTEEVRNLAETMLNGAIIKYNQKQKQLNNTAISKDQAELNKQNKSNQHSGSGSKF